MIGRLRCDYQEYVRTLGNAPPNDDNGGAVFNWWENTSYAAESRFKHSRNATIEKEMSLYRKRGSGKGNL